MEVIISLIGYFIIITIWGGADKIRAELKNRNHLLDEQNKILRRHN